MILLLIVCTLVTIGFGTTLDIFQFRFHGLIGMILQKDAIVDYSFVSIGKSIAIASGSPHKPAVLWMQVCYFLFGLVMPLCLVLLFATLWLVPLSLYRQQQMLVFAHICGAWASLDVFIVALLAALLEIGQVSAAFNLPTRVYNIVYLTNDSVYFIVELYLSFADMTVHYIAFPCLALLCDSLLRSWLVTNAKI